MSIKMNQKDKVEWRRNKVQELLVKGYNHYEIAGTLQISRPTITRDIQYLSQQAKNSIKKYIDERLPEEYEKCLVGLTAILKEAWNTSQQTEDRREKIQALSLAKECYSMKLDLLTNATVVDDAIRFITSSNNQKEEEEGRQQRQQQQQISSEEQHQEEEKAKANGIVIENQDNSSDDIQGSEEEDKQHVRDITSTTTNQTF